jgi:glycosyltransferase involved in cell wall biosynthesis
MNPSLVEAMRAEALVVALDTVFNREVLETTGHFFRGGVGRVEDLSEVLGHVLSQDSTARLRMRGEARERALREYSVEAVTAAYEELLRAAADAGRDKHVRIDTHWSRSA